jgi:signal transduction histidine kinase
MALRIALVIGLTTVVSYWNVHRSLTESGIETLKEYVRERGERESEVFRLAEDNLKVLMRHFMADRAKPASDETGRAFERTFAHNADGAWRRRSGFDVTREPSAYIASRVKADRQVRHEMMTMLDIVTQFGRAWNNRFVSLFLVSIDGLDVTYVPGIDWNRNRAHDVDFAAQPWVQYVLPSNNPKRDPVWTGIWYDAPSKLFAATCLLPTDIDGRFTYYAGTSVYLADILKRTNQTGLTGTHNIIFRADGKLISHPDTQVMAALQAKQGEFSILESGDEHLKALYDSVSRTSGNGVIELDAYGEYLGVTRITGPDWYFITVMPRHVLTQTAKTTAQIVLWLGLVALLLELTIVGWIIRRDVAIPLQRIMVQVLSFAKGNWQSRIDKLGRDELGQLGRTFNQMAQSLEENQKQLEAHAIDLEGKVAERTRQLEQKDHAKTRFLSAASHDLRQPAMAQGLFIDILSRTSLDADQRKLLGNLRNANTATAEMLDTLLDYSRVEAGAIQPQRKNFRLQTLLNKIEREFSAQADARQLIYRSRETDLIVHSDPALLELILRNLVSNAIRYSERGGLLVACRTRGAQVLLEVWDTGIGIAAEYQQEIFDEFMQLGNPERDRHKGLGLGLAIANGLAQRLGHHLSLSSRPGRGSVFRLALPMGTGAPSESVMAPDIPLPLDGVRVLVIDDDAAVRAGLQRLLADWGCQCDAVDAIAAALASARRHAPAVVISDYRLRGGETGIAAIEILRAELGASLPALLITGDIAPERLAEATANRIHIVYKPVQPRELRQQLNRLL